MKFSLQRHTAMAALGAVQQAVGKTDRPILKNVLLQAADGILDITATNLDLQVRHTIPDVWIEVDGAITVPAEKLSASVSSLAEGADFVFDIDQSKPGDQRAVLKSGRAKFTLVTLPPDDFPTMAEESGAAGFTLDAAAMLRLMSIGGSCTARGDTRAYLNGAYMHTAANGALRVVSTDTLRLSWADKGGVDGIAGWGGVILSNSSLDILGRLLRSEAPDAPVTVDAGPSRVTFGIGRSTVITKIIAGRYAPYERILPQKILGRMEGDTDQIIGALTRALVMMDGETQCLTLSFEDGGVSFDTRAANAGELSERVDVEFGGEAKKVNVNGGYLRDLLSRIRTENVVFRLSDDPMCMTVEETGATDMFSFVGRQRG